MSRSVIAYLPLRPVAQPGHINLILADQHTAELAAHHWKLTSKIAYVCRPLQPIEATWISIAHFIQCAVHHRFSIRIYVHIQDCEFLQEVMELVPPRVKVPTHIFDNIPQIS